MQTIEILIRPGQRLYRFNAEDGSISEVDTSGNTSRFYSAEYKQGELYASALNLTNAERKFNKMIEYILNKYQ